MVYILDEDCSGWLVEYRGEKERKERSADIRAARVGEENDGWDNNMICVCLWVSLIHHQRFGDETGVDKMKTT